MSFRLATDLSRAVLLTNSIVETCEWKTLNAKVASLKEHSESRACTDGSPLWMQAKEKYQMMLNYNSEFLDLWEITGMSQSIVEKA